MALNCWPFLSGFLPGILIGIFSSFLLFALWRNPYLAHQEERELQHVSIHLGMLPKFELPRALQRTRNIEQRRKERRAIYKEHENESCNTSYWLNTQPVNQGPYLLLVLVHSTPRATDLRNTIRTTWVSDNNQQQQYLARFVIGTAGLKPKDVQLLACENKEHGDLILLPEITDPVKTIEWSSSEKLLESFLWAIDHVDFSYIFKCSDATFAILPTLTEELETRDPADDYLWGFFAGGVQATKDGRIGEKDWFLCSHYLPYPHGGGYVISHGLVSMLSVLSEDLQHYTHDDIALGVWLSPFENIEKKHDVRFNTGLYSRGCNNVYIVTHKETPQSMFKKFTVFKHNGFVCEKEFLSRLSYVYNWTSPANRCCVRKPGIP